MSQKTEVLGVTMPQAGESLQTAEKLALWGHRGRPPAALLGCPADIAAADPAAQRECVAAWLPDFARRAYRRPAEPHELTALLATYERGAADSFADGVQYVLTRMLLAPAFTYRVELGTPVPEDSQVVRLNSWDLASRLSYLPWQSMPDDALLAAAAADALGTPEQVAAEVDRLLADERARVTVRDDFRQRLELFGGGPLTGLT